MPPAAAGAVSRSAEPTLTSPPIGPYSPIVRAGDWLVVSGQIGHFEGSLVSGGIVQQTRQALANLAALLEGEGSSLNQVVKTTVFLRHIGDYPDMNQTYAEVFAGRRPARSAAAVGALPMDALVEIEAWAYTA